MNKLEILKKAFEEIGFKCRCSYDKELERHSLIVEGDFWYENPDLLFEFDKNFEPLVRDYYDYNKVATIGKYYEDIEKSEF